MKDHFNNRHANGTISQDGDSESIDDSQVFVPELKSMYYDFHQRILYLVFLL